MVEEAASLAAKKAKKSKRCKNRPKLETIKGRKASSQVDFNCKYTLVHRTSHDPNFVFTFNFHLFILDVKNGALIILFSYIYFRKVLDEDALDM